MNKRTYRNIQSLLLLGTILVLGMGFYFEYVKGLQPCPLCLMQRLSTFLFGTFCLMGLCLSTLHRARTVAVFQMVLTAFGLFFAGRQMWLQSLPAEQTATCMPSLDMLFHYFSKDQVFKALFWGTGDCGEVGGRWFGLSLPSWSALYFLVMLIISGIVFGCVERRLITIKSK